MECLFQAPYENLEHSRGQNAEISDVKLCDSVTAVEFDTLRQPSVGLICSNNKRVGTIYRETDQWLAIGGSLVVPFVMP
jgi:hypothetical protein